jgi:hypothetical protein
LSSKIHTQGKKALKTAKISAQASFEIFGSAVPTRKNAQDERCCDDYIDSISWLAKKYFINSEMTIY